MATYNHNLRDMIDQLDAKISELQVRQAEIQSKLAVNITMNTAALAQCTASLTAAQAARESLDVSCCNQANCNIEWDT